MTQQSWPSLALPEGYHVTETGLTGPYISDVESCVYTPLTHQQLLSVEGQDAFSFLQGQLSCDLREAIREGSRLGAHCNIKGHMISLFRVMAQSEQHFWLRTDTQLAEKAFAQLKKYIIFSKATLAVESNMYGLGLMGKDVIDRLKQMLNITSDECPMHPSSTLVKDAWTLCCISENRYELWMPTEQLITLLAQLSETAQPMPLQQWILQDIREGIADLRPETSELFIPQMTNLQVFDGISFRKGCYTGQEIITRLQHRGILKRPMYRVRCHASSAPAPGTLIHCDDKEGVGQVVLSAQTGDTGCYEMLAVIVKDRAENDTLWIADHSALEVLTLPYTLDTRLFESKR